MLSKISDKDIFDRKAREHLENILSVMNDAILDKKLKYDQDHENCQLFANAVFTLFRVNGNIPNVVTRQNFVAESPECFHVVPNNQKITPEIFAEIIKSIRVRLAKQEADNYLIKQLNPIVLGAENFLRSHNDVKASSTTLFEAHNQKATQSECYLVYSKADENPIDAFNADPNNALDGVPYATEEEAQKHLMEHSVKGFPHIAKLDIDVTQAKLLIQDGCGVELLKHMKEAYDSHVEFSGNQLRAK